MYLCHCNASCTDVTFQSYAVLEKRFGLTCDLKWESRIFVHALVNMRQSSKNNEKQFEVSLRCCGGCLCQDSFRSILSTFRGSLNVLARWIELHLRREWMEIKLLYKAWVALPSTWQSGKCCISKLYNVSQMWGKVKVGVKEKKRGAKPYSRSDNWRCEKTRHGFSSSSRRLSAVLLLEVIVLIVRNVWPPLWETALRTHSCHSLGTWILPQRVQWWGAGRVRYAFYLKMASWDVKEKLAALIFWRWSTNLRDLYFVNLHWTYFSFL